MSDRIAALRRIAMPSVVVLAITLIGAFLPTYWQYVFGISIAAMVIGVALVMLVGYARCITIASGAMMAVGAYASSVAVLRYQIPYPVALLLGTAFGALAGWILAVPAVRFRSHNLAMVTLVFQEVLIITLREAKELTGGAEGLKVPTATLFGVNVSGDLGSLLMMGIASALAMLPLAILLAGPFGKGLRAIAANEVGARAYGIRPRSYLIAAFVVSSAAIAFAGALSAPRIRIIDPESFNVLQSIFMLAYPIIGGMSSLWGGIMGGGILRILPEVLRPLADYLELAFCVLVVLTVMYFPGGFVELVRRVTGRGTSKTAIATQPDATPAGDPHEAILHSMRATGGSAAKDAVPALRLDGMSRSFGALQAVKDVSIEVAAGSLHGLMGPNGAGKTTLFNMVHGFTRADAGRVAFFGQDVAAIPVEDRLSLGVTRTFQHVALFPSLSCLDNTIVGLGANGVGASISRSLDAAVAGTRVAREREAALAALDAVGLASLAGSPAGSLSLGNQRRLEIARAIVSRPRIILLDEPVSGVGAEETARLRELLTAINRDLGVTMLVIEHNIAFLVSLCSRLTVMSHGEVIAEGTPDDVVSASHVRTAYFGEKAA